MQKRNQKLTFNILMFTSIVFFPLSSWAAPAASRQELQEDINQQGKEIKDLMKEFAASKKDFNISSGATMEYQYRFYKNNSSGGSLLLDYIPLSIYGSYGKHWKYAISERFSTSNIANNAFLHYGWIGYNFGHHGNQQIRFGFFHEPFGNLPYGYDSFWGSLGYYAGFTDHQAAGLEYKYKHGSWSFAAAAFKNDNLGQPSTYAAGVPTGEFKSNNGGDLRVAYKYGSENDFHGNLSVAAKGGEFLVDNRNSNRWAATVATNDSWNNWNVKGQLVDYYYNIPAGSLDSSGQLLPRTSITAENYGYSYQMPARGLLMTASIERHIPVHIGPLRGINLYDDYGYLDVLGKSIYSDDTKQLYNNVQLNVAGAEFVVKPLYIWAEYIAGRNAGMAFVGSNNNHWHSRFNLAVGFYFSAL